MSQQIRSTREFYNGSLAESAANTLRYSNIEIPGSAGAIAVDIEYAACASQWPLVPPGANGDATSTVSIAAGKLTTTTPGYNEPGALCVGSCTRSSAGAGVPAGSAVFVPGTYLGPPFRVSKSPTDGKFYFTLTVSSTGDAVTLIAGTYFVVFRVYR